MPISLNILGKYLLLPEPVEMQTVDLYSFAFEVFAPHF